MKVSIHWLKQLIDLKLTPEELAQQLSLHTIGIKDLTENYLELDMKGYNRADLLSLRGVANELSALTDSPLKFVEPERYTWEDQNFSKLTTIVENSDLCPLYCLAKIEGLKVERSDLSTIKKLEGSGIRPVNNLADITNLVMVEYGQPLHAFDAKTVEDETILVRTARQGADITTLDGKTRRLLSTDLLITDHSKPLGVAGVMGGQNSEVTEKTETILLEAAIFDPISIRSTATRLGLTSEASKRFQHGLTKKRLLQAFDAAIRMYQDLGGNLVGLTIVGDITDPVKRIKLSKDHLDSLIGVKIPETKVEEYLTKLGFSKGKGWQVPYWRLDIDNEEDLIEEVARIYGYHQIPSIELPGEPPKPIDQSQFKLIDQLKDSLQSLGLTEVQTYSFYSTKVLKALGWDQSSDQLIKLSNPMSVETTYLRSSVWPNLLEVVEKNLKVRFDDIAIFEIGKNYQLSDGVVKEGYELSLALVNGSDNPLDELHAITKKLLEKLALEVTLTPGEAPEIYKPLFHPHRFIKLELNGQMIGGIAQIHPRVLDHLGINKRVAVVGLELEKLLNSDRKE